MPLCSSFLMSLCSCVLKRNFINRGVFGVWGLMDYQMKFSSMDVFIWRKCVGIEFFCDNAVKFCK